MSLITDPAAPVALFPGQGSQTPEMRDLVAHRAPDLLERVTALVGEDPFPRAGESTRFAQPAIFCASLAGWDALGLEPAAAAGHSLGELAALAAAGVLAREDALRLVVLRGELMADADDVGSMLALVGATQEDAEAVAAEAGVTVANDNAPGQVVLSGPREKLARAEEAAKRARPPRAAARRRRRLPLAEHGAGRRRRSAPRSTRPSCTRPPSPSSPARRPSRSRTSAPSWPPRSPSPCAGGRPCSPCTTPAPSRFVEVGPGKVLARLGKRILPDFPVETPPRSSPMRSAELPADLATIAREATRNGSDAARARAHARA